MVYSRRKLFFIALKAITPIILTTTSYSCAERRRRFPTNRPDSGNAIEPQVASLTSELSSSDIRWIAERDPKLAINNRTQRATIIRAAKLLKLESFMPKGIYPAFEIIIGSEVGQSYLYVHLAEDALKIIHRVVYNGEEDKPETNIKIGNLRLIASFESLFNDIMNWEPNFGRGQRGSTVDAAALYFSALKRGGKNGLFCISDPWTLDVKNINQLLDLCTEVENKALSLSKQRVI